MGGCQLDERSSHLNRRTHSAHDTQCTAGVVTAPYPYCLHCKARQAAGGLGYGVPPNIPPLGAPYEQRRCCGGPLEALEWMLKTHSAPSVSLP